MSVVNNPFQWGLRSAGQWAALLCLLLIKDYREKKVTNPSFILWLMILASTTLDIHTKAGGSWGGGNWKTSNTIEFFWAAHGMKRLKASVEKSAGVIVTQEPNHGLYQLSHPWPCHNHIPLFLFTGQERKARGEETQRLAILIPVPSYWNQILIFFLFLNRKKCIVQMKEISCGIWQERS